MEVNIRGLPELVQGLDNVASDLGDFAEVVKTLADDLRKEAPIRTGYLRSTVYYRDDHVGADAPYAGFVADIYQDYAQAAIDSFALERYADFVVRRY